MDAPKCKICEGRHYGLCPAPKVAQPNAREAEAIANSSKGVTVGETTTKFDKVAYQREYMRKRRAA